MDKALTQEPLLNSRSQQEKASDLRKALASEKPLCVPGAFNALVAKLAERKGFPAVYVSGAALHNGITGYPDIGLLTQSEMAQFSGYIARATNVPTIADVDTGFGEALNVVRTVQRYEQEGIAAIHLEDQVFPKRCGHLGGKAVIPTEHMVAKVRAACQARSNPETLIIARVDSRSVHGFDDALTRARAYVDAGAEMIFPEALKDATEFEHFATQLRQTHPHVWLLANMTEFGQTPLYTTDQFGDWGYNLVIFPMTFMRVLQKTMDEALGLLKAQGTQAHFMDRMASRQELYDLIRYNDYTALDDQLSFTI